MARRINLSQFRSKLRQIEAQRRQAIARYNQKVRRGYTQGETAIPRILQPGGNRDCL